MQSVRRNYYRLAENFLLVSLTAQKSASLHDKFPADYKSFGHVKQIINRLKIFAESNFVYHAAFVFLATVEGRAED